VATIRVFAIVIALGALGGSIACNPWREKECDKLLGAMKPIDEGTPSTEAVSRVSKEVEGLSLEDQPLHIYATNYQTTLTVLSSALSLRATAEPPDGTDELIQTRLKEARAARADVQRYCSQ
jgi:hypothetical protein